MPMGSGCSHGQITALVYEGLSFTALQTSVTTSQDKALVGFEPADLQQMKLGAFGTNIAHMAENGALVNLFLNCCREYRCHGDLFLICLKYLHSRFVTGFSLDQLFTHGRYLPLEPDEPPHEAPDRPHRVESAEEKVIFSQLKLAL